MTLSRRNCLRLLAGGLAAALVPPNPPLYASGSFSYGLAPRVLGPGLWLVEGLRETFTRQNGGDIVNIVLIETGAGLVVVDTGSSRRYGEELRAVAEQATGQAVAEVWITHHHPDHFLGNQAFADVPIRATPYTTAEIRSRGDGYADALYRLLGDWMRGTAPHPPTDPMPLGAVEVGGRRFRVEEMSGHTGSDLVVLDEESGILIASDLVFLDYAPTTPDADLDQWRASLERLRTFQARAIVPGHGPVDVTGRGLDQTRRYLDWLEETLWAAAQRGEDMMEAMATELPPEWAALGAQPQEFQRSVIHLFPTLERRVLPRL